MKQPKRILAYSAVALLVMLAAFGAIAFDTSNVAHAQSVPMAPTLTAQASGASTINLSWTAVTDATRYELWAWDNVNEWQRLDGGETTPLVATSYSHTGLTSGTTYYYQVRAINDNGDAGAWSARVNEVAGTAPARPVLTATPGYLQITVSWTAVAGAARYELWAWDNSWTRLDSATNQITGTSYTHPGLTGGRTYYYQARSVDSGGVMSAWSGQVNATVLSSPNISAPTSFTAARGDQMITLNWAAPASTAGLTLASYEYRHAAVGATLPTTWTPVGNVLTTDVTGLTNGTTYNFELRAVSTTDAKGEVASASGTPSTVPDAPTLTATEGYRFIVLSWTAPDNGGAAITSYRIERENNDGTWSNARTVPGSTLTWTATGLSDSVLYTYRIFAINVAGDSDWTSASARTLANPIAAPAAPAPATTQVTNGPGEITYFWLEPNFNGGSAVTSYEYRYKTSDSSSWTSWMDNGTKLSVKIENLDPDEEYDFEVAARNIVGRGAALEIEGGDPTPTAPLRAPTLRATLGATSTGNPQISLSWNVLHEDHDGGSAITGYQLRFKLSTAADWPTETDGSDTIVTPGRGGFSAINPPTITNPNVTATHGDDSDTLTPGTTYQYQVRAINDADANNSDGEDGEIGPWSTTVMATTDPVLPTRPVLNPVTDDPTDELAAWTISDTSITVQWAAPNNGGAEITGYELQVRTGDAVFFTDDGAGDGTPSDTIQNGGEEDAAGNTTIPNLPGNRMEYTHNGLKPQTGYYYRLRAKNSVGFSPWSEPSAVATTTETPQGTHDAPTLATINETPAGSGTFVVTWTAATVTGNLAPVTRFELQFLQRDSSTNAGDNPADDLAALDAAVTAGNANIVVPTPPTNTTYSHTGLPGLKRYVYRVRAINSAGASSWSAVEADDAATTVARDPGTPMLNATAIGSNEILLEWTKPDGNGTTIEGYEVVQWDPDPAGDGSSAAAWGTADLLEDDLATTGVDEDTADVTVLTVSDLDAGTTYYYRIRATWTGQSATAGWSATSRDQGASATTASGAPSAPSLSAASGTAMGSITLTIGGTAGVTSLELQRWYNGQWTSITAPAVGATMYTDSGLMAGETYYYALRATNSFGTSGWSDIDSAMATAGNPDPPTLTTTSESQTSIRLSWNVPANNGTPITGYQIQKWDSGASNWTTATDAELPTTATSDYTATQVIDTGLTAGSTHYYRIRALPQVVETTGDDPDDLTDEGWSAEDTAETGEDAPEGATMGMTLVDGPGAPTQTSAPTATTNSITILWTAPDDIGGSAITKYEVYKWNGSSWVHETDVLAVTGQTDYTSEDMGLASGTTHYYIVRAVNAHGPGDWSQVFSSTTDEGDIEAPMLTATPRSTSAIQLTWNIPEANGNTITGFTLQRWNGAAFATIQVDVDGSPTDLTLSASTTLYVDSGLAAGTQQWYQIQATGTDAAGTAIDAANVVFSAVATATTIADVPARVVLTRPIPAGDITHNSVKLTWTTPDANGSAIIHYEVQVWNASTTSWDRLALISATRLTYTHRNLDAESRYIYRVRAQNRAPNTDGFVPFSTIISATTDEAPDN